MGYPDNMLTREEDVKLHTHPHWKEVFLPVIWFVVFILVAAILIYLVPNDWEVSLWLQMGIGLVFTAIIVWLSVIPYINWQTTHYVLTNRRIMWRTGIVRRNSTAIPLSRVNTVSFEQNIVERLLGFGTLKIESASNEGVIELIDVPKVDSVKAMIYQLAEDDRTHQRTANQGVDEGI
ncbi:PH domain-containing protein [Natronoglycomyces albus]|uniref:PH domain-containing protein n=1 Tax=Natronoglycomyces albus TaxID=2811108 RepID=A0A895XKS3_9ACTN|nr:PH domain-containing protein [Natronoglycomyces albus]QSB05924.1 PH domain-containing protein [Natronoglycomyces albus]